MTTLASQIGGERRVIGGPFGSKLTQADYVPEGVPVIRGSNMEADGRWIGGDFVFVSPDKVARDLASNIARPGDIIVTQRGTMGQVLIIPDWLGYDQFVVSQSQMAISVDADRVDRDFVYFYLKSPGFADYLEQSIIQVGVPHINLGLLRNAPAEWPVLDVQREISQALAPFDDKIELNRRMNETLEAMAQAIFRDWFVDFGPVRRKLASERDPVAIMGGLTIDPGRAAVLAALFPDQFSGDGRPLGWELKPFSDLVEIVGGGTPKTSVAEYWDGDIPWFSVVDTPRRGDVFVFDTEKTISSLGLENSSARLIHPGTTIISARGTVGNLAVAARAMTFNQSCYALQPKTGAHPAFVFLAARELVSSLQNMAHGSVFSTITRQTFAGTSFVRAPSPVLDAAEQSLWPLFERISASVEENRTLVETRDYLLPRLMSGKVRITDLEAPERQARAT